MKLEISDFICNSLNLISRTASGRIRLLLRVVRIGGGRSNTGQTADTGSNTGNTDPTAKKKQPRIKRASSDSGGKKKLNIDDAIDLGKDLMDDLLKTLRKVEDQKSAEANVDRLKELIMEFDDLRSGRPTFPKRK